MVQFLQKNAQQIDGKNLNLTPIALHIQSLSQHFTSSMDFSLF